MGDEKDRNEFERSESFEGRIELKRCVIWKFNFIAN